MSLAKQEFTDVGKSMLGRAQNTEILRITKLVVGSGTAGTPDQLWPLTALIAHEMDVNISTRRDYGNGIMLVEGSFRSDQAPHAFLIKELGVMAHIGAEADRLYSVGNVFADPADNVDPASPSVHTFKVKLIIDRIPTGQLDVSIGPTEAIMGENIGADTVGAGAYKEAVGNVLRFKRFVEGSGMEIRDEEETIYIGISTLNVDLDLYVPASHPDCPSPEVGFPSVQAAHDHLLQYIIPAARLARIHVYQGALHHNGTTFSHPNAKQIQLLGHPRQDRAVTAINFVAGGLFKNVACSTTGLAVGQIVYLTDCHSGWTGGCKITAIGAGFVTCSVLNRSTRNATNPFNISDPGASRMSWFPTVLVNDNATFGISNLLLPNGINRIENITVEKGYAGFGLGDWGGIVKNCLAIGCVRGFSIGTGTIKFEGECIACDCDFGITGAGIIFSNEVLFLNGCGSGAAPSGIGSGIGAISAGMPNTWVYINHCIRGLHGFGGSNLRCGHILYDTNDIGLAAEKGSIFQCSPEAGTPYNNTTDLYAQGQSYIEYFRAGQTAPTCSPPAETIGNQNSLIHVVP